MKQTIEFHRKPAELMRKALADVIRSGMNLRGDRKDELSRMLTGLPLDRPITPQDISDPNVILRSQFVNSLLDLTLLDTMVLYNDAYTIQDELQRIQRLFDDHVGTLLMNVETISTESLAIARRRELGISVSHAFHRTPIAEGTTNGFYGVQINSSARKYRLAALSTNHASESSAKATASLLSEESRIIVEGDWKNVFSNNILTPYYVIINSEGEPYNNNTSLGHFFDNELGVVVSIVVRFNNVVPVSRVRIQPFSNSRVNVLGVFVPSVPNARWKLDVFTPLTAGKVRQSSREIEITFPRTYTSELHIVLNQQSFITVPEDTYVGGRDLNDYLAYVSRALTRILPDGYTTSDERQSVSRLLEAVEASLAVPRILVRGGSRLYILGLSTLIVEDTSYQVYGLHESVSELVDANPTRVSMLFDENVSASSDPDFVTLGYITYAGKRHPIVPLGSGSEIADAIIVPYQEDPDNYVFPLNFLVDTGFALTVRCGGVSETIPANELSQYVYTDSDHSVLVIPRERLESVTITNGVPTAFFYHVPTITLWGERYNPEVLDIVNVAGGVTMDMACRQELHEHPLYVHIASGECSWLCVPERSYAPVESGYVVYDTCGLSELSVFEPIGDYAIVSADDTWGPFSGCYKAIVNEAVTLVPVASGEGYVECEYQTEYPYVRGSVKVLVDNTPVLVEEYPYDYLKEGVPVVCSDEERSQLTLYIETGVYERIQASTMVRASYIPLGAEGDQAAISTIRTPNAREIQQIENAQSITLQSPVFVDSAIVRAVSTGEFGLTESGVFYLRRGFDVVYEPITIFANGVKCRNVTDFLGTGKSPSLLPSIPSFWLDSTNKRRIMFDRPLTGSLRIEYYTVPVSVTGGFMFFHTNPQRESESPWLQWYDVLVDTN